jgi:hypothetical protein
MGKMPLPITVNPDHVTRLEPRSRPIPNQGSQSGGLLPHYEGTAIHFVTGERELVLEDYEVVHARLWPPQQQYTSLVRQGNITGLDEAMTTLPTLSEADSWIPEPSPEPAKKAPAPKAEGKPISDKVLAEESEPVKKPKPELIDRTETTKITVEKDEPKAEEKGEA